MLIGWALDIAVLKSVLPGWVSVKPNTAAAFILLGLSLAGLTRRSKATRHAAGLSALLAGLLGAVTLLEYALDWDPGLDQLLFRESADAVATSVPGRMAPETALCFLLLAAAVLLCDTSRNSRRRLLAAATASLFVTVLAGAALLSYLIPVLGAFGWWGQTIIAVPSALTFGVLGLCTLRNALRQCQGYWMLNKSTTIAFTCGLVLLLLIHLNTSRSQIQATTLAANISQSEQISAGYRVILAEVTRAQSHNRGFALTGEPGLLAALREADASSRAALKAQRSLPTATGSPEPAPWMEQVDEALRWFHFTAESSATTYDAALRAQRVLQGEALMSQLRATFDQLESTERARRSELQQESRKIGRISFAILSSGTLLSGAFFFAALFRLNSAESARNQAEAELRATNLSLEEKVGRRTAELARSKQLLEQAGHLARVGGWEVDLVHQRVHWTEVTREIHEVGPEFAPTLGEESRFYTPDSAPLISAAMQQAITTGQPFDLELQLVSARGGRLWVRTMGEALREEGKVTRLIGVIQDVTARRQAMEELQRQRELLQAANRELESFAYSVSHDLRAPLRSIDGFSRILLEDYRDKLDAEGRDSIDRIRAAAQRMAQLIDDMLQLSRVTRSEVRLQPVDLSRLAEDVIAELSRSQPERRIEAIVHPGITAYGDPPLLRILLENLLGNAWKFTQRREVARIEFGLVSGEQGTDYFVRDNGAGFDPTYVHKLFGAFQRLHTSSEFPGTGIGLATVQRIVLRHGGRVRAEGRVDAGATFYFNLGTTPPTNPAPS